MASFSPKLSINNTSIIAQPSKIHPWYRQEQKVKNTVGSALAVTVVWLTRSELLAIAKSTLTALGQVWLERASYQTMAFTYASTLTTAQAAIAIGVAIIAIGIICYGAHQVYKNYKAQQVWKQSIPTKVSDLKSKDNKFFCNMKSKNGAKEQWRTLSLKKERSLITAFAEKTNGALPKDYLPINKEFVLNIFDRLEPAVRNSIYLHAKNRESFDAICTTNLQEASLPQGLVHQAQFVQHAYPICTKVAKLQPTLEKTSIKINERTQLAQKISDINNNLDKQYETISSKIKELDEVINKQNEVITKQNKIIKKQSGYMIQQAKQIKIQATSIEQLQATIKSLQPDINNLKEKTDQQTTSIQTNKQLIAQLPQKLDLLNSTLKTQYSQMGSQLANLAKNNPRAVNKPAQVNIHNFTESIKTLNELIATLEPEL